MWLIQNTNKQKAVQYFISLHLYYTLLSTTTKKNAYKTHIVRISVKTVNKGKKISRKRQMNGRKSFVFLNHKKKKWNEKNRVFALHEKIITDI